MGNCTNGCGCSQQEMQALICELLDNCCESARAQQIRARIAECTECNEHLTHEESIRQMVRNCCGAPQAPARLRERITMQIRVTRTEIRYNG